MREYDDDDDVVYNNNNVKLNATAHSDEEDYNNEYNSDSFNEDELDDNFEGSTRIRPIFCKYCNAKLTLDESGSPTSSGNTASCAASPPQLDLVIFNYAREIYFYEFSQLKQKVS